jgi:ectoine hydroxylase-related dioxygenase (phytanoyl-CoA dioxygenase family)
MAEICRKTLGDEAYLFWEQYVIKAGDPNTAFAWHQDSGYVHEDHTPYLTCWIALDDVTEENGSVYLLPYSRSGIKSYIKHIRDPKLNDMVCYFGSDPGIPMTASAGSIVVFSSVVIHRSGPNLTDRNRRVYIAQYSEDIIQAKDGSRAHGSFDPFLKAGQVIADR